MFSAGAQVSGLRVAAFASSPNVTQLATMRLREAGFEILQVTPLTINIAGPPDLFESCFRTKIVEREMAQSNAPTSTHLDSPDTDVLGLISTVGTSLDALIEGVAIEVPRRYFDASPAAPAVDYWHLDVPSDVSAAANASALHRLGITGRGVKVAMVDSGWYRHPYFTSHGYDVAPVVLAPAASEPDMDESGHGTGESANILAIAPDCQLLPVKANFVNTIGAFNAAAALQPDIITCSWGSHCPFVLSAADMALAASVAAAVASGITVIFSAGNGHAGFPGQHPDVISAGGVFMAPDGMLMASNYSSGFVSNIYPGRRVPDVCGLVGLRPKAIYILLPVQPADSIDVDNAGSIFPDGDQTAADDGWAGFSGTSAAAPQLAGAAALIKQVAPHATPAQVRDALCATARDVVLGLCSPVGPLHDGLPAEPGPDDATGTGLVDVTAAVTHAYLAATTGAPPLAPAPEPVGEHVSFDPASAYFKGVADALTLLGAPQAAAYWEGISTAVALSSAAPASTPAKERAGVP
jgi:subtilisin family serine protease